MKTDPVVEAAKARSDLNMYYAIIALCEGSLFSSRGQSAEARIIKICRSESAKALVRYDTARALAGSNSDDQ